MSAHANEAPLLGWDNLPFLATTYEANNKLWAAAKDKVNAQLDSLNLVALYTCPWPGQGFYFKKPVTSSADTQGVKFRSYNAATATFAKELGMTRSRSRLPSFRRLWPPALPRPSSPPVRPAMTARFGSI